MNNLLIDVKNSKDIAEDIRIILEQSQALAYRTIDLILLQRNWLIGKRIYEEELSRTRANNYAKNIIDTISNVLSNKFGKGFTSRNLYNYVKFYTLYKNIFHSASAKSFLSWTHYRTLLSVEDEKARVWYENEALECHWSVRTLQRNVNTQYYYRILKTNDRNSVSKEMEEKTINYQLEKLEHIKNPVILEFLDLKQNFSYLESTLEQQIIDNLQEFMIELGKGYTFVGRQYHIHTNEGDYYVDLVFYNYKLKCFVLVDLKTAKITHQDVGQMDMYIRMFDELIKDENDNPTFGIILCSETSEDIAKYSILKGHEQLFATKYKLYLPLEAELKAEIEHQKTLFELQQLDKNKK